DAAPPDASDGERAAQLLDSGRAAEAVPILRKQLDRVIAANGEHNILTAGALNNLGVALEKAGDLDGAIEMLERSLKIREGISGPSDPMTLALRERLAKLRAQRGHQ
ncbi:MAG TPA: tetratricopeptide repeat protein, partial [Kofleriaceae bacterium]|nr:tetratricopeptide repeat protein [Kofleriaceae bacterium]